MPSRRENHHCIYFIPSSRMSCDCRGFCIQYVCGRGHDVVRFSGCRHAISGVAGCGSRCVRRQTKFPGLGTRVQYLSRRRRNRLHGGTRRRWSVQCRRGGKHNVDRLPDWDHVGIPGHGGVRRSARVCSRAFPGWQHAVVFHVSFRRRNRYSDGPCLGCDRQNICVGDNQLRSDESPKFPHHDGRFSNHFKGYEPILPEQD